MTSPDDGSIAPESAPPAIAGDTQANAGERAPHWPEVPPVDGGLYSFACPTHGSRMMAMTLETFIDLRQTLERFRGAVTDAKAENIKLFQETQQLQKQLTEAVRPKPAVEKPEIKIITPRNGM